MKQVFKFRTIGISADNALNLLSIQQPNYIKIDVDGIEHLILSGGIHVLSIVDGVLVEVNDDFLEHAANIYSLLAASGLKLHSKLHSEYIENSSNFYNMYNQIWI